MRTNKLLYALGIGCTLCACSTVDEPGTSANDQDFIGSNKYVTVAIVTDAATRAASDYTDGDAKEYDVNSVAFYFFDRQGNCVDTELVGSDKFTFSSTGVTNIDPAVTVMGQVEVELAANRVYDSVIAILNPNSDLLSEGSLKTKSKNDITAYFANYSGDQKSGTKGNFTMSNSVYIDNENYTGTGSFTPCIAVPITSHNIYTKEVAEDKMTADQKTALDKERAEKAIDIYVERVCSKVMVEEAPAFTSFFVDKDGTETDIAVLVYDNNKSVEKKITVKPVFKGMGLSVTSKNARLLKNLNSTLTYGFNDDITNFVWNDVKNKRTYWESTIGEATAALGGGFDYTAWENITSSTFSAYINPNTVDALSFNNDKADKTTKLLVCAQLTYVPEGETEAKPLDLVKFSGGYWMADYLKYHAAQRAAEDVAALDFSTVITDETELATVKTEVAKITRDVLEGKVTLVRKTDKMAEAYLAELSIKNEKGEYPELLAGLTTANKSKVVKMVNDQIQQTLDDITARQIQYWKDGMTYFYVPIRHEGFTGLTGGTNGNYLNGVVRNHVYKINISKIWGLGTPVIDPKNPIDPERPDDAPDSYMTAKIHVLKWRVVESNVTMH